MVSIVSGNSVLIVNFVHVCDVSKCQKCWKLSALGVSHSQSQKPTDYIQASSSSVLVQNSS